MQPLVIALYWLIDTVLAIFVYLLIASAIMSWLYAFNVVNTRNQFVRSLGDFLYRITEPVLRPVRNVMPNIGGIDISPIVVILLISFIRMLLGLYTPYLL
ncbi:MAG TPA: YggT family protein [Azospirillaceae bacterium]|nr:YggT family protein [Azospirillaceae bacterium]